MGQKDAVPRVFKLTGTCNNYPWGKKGRESLAARLHEKSPSTGFEINDHEPYSEMWFGDYPDYPARVLETQLPLAELLSRPPLELLGQKLMEKDAQLPYLPKVITAYDKVADSVRAVSYGNLDFVHRKGAPIANPSQQKAVRRAAPASARQV